LNRKVKREKGNLKHKSAGISKSEGGGKKKYEWLRGPRRRGETASSPNDYLENKKGPKGKKKGRICSLVGDKRESWKTNRREKTEVSLNRSQCRIKKRQGARGTKNYQKSHPPGTREIRSAEKDPAYTQKVSN